jgi:hypothetical protein
MLNSTPDLSTDSTVTALSPVLADLRAFAKNLVIKTVQGYEAAAERLKHIKGALATIEDARTRITKPLNETLREVNAQAKTAAAPFLADEQTIKRAMIAFSDEQDRRRREEQRRLDEKAEADRRRLLEAAQRNEAKGNTAKADAFEERAAQVVAPVAQTAAPKVAGISVPEVWDFEVTDEDLIPRAYCEVSAKRIRAQVQATKGMTQIPGVRVFKTKRIAAGVA